MTYETEHYKVIKYNYDWGVYSKLGKRYIIFCATKKQAIEKVMQWEKEGRF